MSLLASPSSRRSYLSVTLATCQPSPRPMTIWSTGTRTSVKNISLKVARPVMVTSGRTSMPGVFIGTSR